LSSSEEILKIWKRDREAFRDIRRSFFYVCRNCWQLWLHTLSLFHSAPQHEAGLLVLSIDLTWTQLHVCGLARHRRRGSERKYLIVTPESNEKNTPNHQIFPNDTNLSYEHDIDCVSSLLSNHVSVCQSHREHQ
jgi:hypothetical protein